MHITNNSDVPFAGWIRRTIDFELAPEVEVAGGGEAPDLRVLIGRRVGIASRVVDLHVRRAPRVTGHIGFAALEPRTQPLPAFTAEQKDIAAQRPVINGHQMGLVSSRGNGAGLDLHFHVRIGPMLSVDFFATVYPEQPWGSGEALINASNPDVGDMKAIFAGLEIQWAGAVFWPVPGYVGGPLRAGPDHVGDGQIMAVPVTFGWRQIADLDDILSAGAAAQWSVTGIGCRSMWPLGNPGTTYDPVDVALELHNAKKALGGWDAHKFGIKASAFTTGEEGDQVFVGGQCAKGFRSAYTELVAYAIALGYGRRPVHHLEPDGKPLDYNKREGKVVLWNGRPHFGLSTDKLGKTQEMNYDAESHGWRDYNEHEFFNWLAVALRLMGTPGLQRLLHHQGIQQLLTAKKFGAPGSHVTGAREWAWWSLAIYHCWHLLDDRALAQRLKDRWLAEANAFMAHNNFGKADPGRWDLRYNAGSLSSKTGRDPNVMTYQNALCAYMTNLVGQLFGHAEIAERARKEAAWIVNTAFSHHEGRWKGWGYVGFQLDTALRGGRQRAPLVEGDGAHHGKGIENWMWLAPVVVLKHDMRHPSALEMVRQAIRERNEELSWIPPEAYTLAAEVS